MFAILNIIIDELIINFLRMSNSWRLIPKDRRKEESKLFAGQRLPASALLGNVKNRTVEEWYEAWPAFDKRVKKLIEEEGFTHMIVSDIMAYLKICNHDVLKSVLIEVVAGETNSR